MKVLLGLGLLLLVVGCGESNSVEMPKANTEVPPALKSGNLKEAAPSAPARVP